MKTIISFLLLTCCIQQAAAQVEWQHCYGGTGDDECNAIRTTFDGGYILAGWSFSYDGDISGTHGDGDFWVVKITAAGAIEWQKCYGGGLTEEAYDIRQTADSGYIVVGVTTSGTTLPDGEVSGNHGGEDMWVIKITADGTLQWQKCLGGSGTDIAFSVGLANDGGYIVAGITNSTDWDVSGFHGDEFHNDFDYWVVKLADTGSIEWAKCYGGTNTDMAWAVQQTYDGGYIVEGSSSSDNGDVTGHHGDTTTSDVWVLKLTAAGSMEWERSLGGTGNEGGIYTDFRDALIQTMDSGYIAATYTSSDDGDVTGLIGAQDGWVVKLSDSGAVQWNRCISVGEGDVIHAISQAGDGGYVIAGTSGPLSALFGKLSATGSIVGVDTLGVNSGWSYFSSVAQANGDTSIAAGRTFENTGLPDYHGGDDYWVVKFGWPTGVANIEKVNTVIIVPNPANKYLSITASDKITNVIITDLVGQVVYTNKYNAEKVEADVSELPVGMYFVKVNGVFAGRFIKE